MDQPSLSLCSTAFVLKVPFFTLGFPPFAAVENKYLSILPRHNVYEGKNSSEFRGASIDNPGHRWVGPASGERKDFYQSRPHQVPALTGGQRPRGGRSRPPGSSNHSHPV